MIDQKHMKVPVLFLTMALTYMIGSPLQADKPELVPLTAHGGQLEAQYLQTMLTLRDQIIGSLPANDSQATATYLQACDAEKRAEAELAAVDGALADIEKARALVAHAENKWIGGAEKGIREATAKLSAASTDTEREEARIALAKWQANKAEGEAALSDRQAALDSLLTDEPAHLKARDQAKRKLATARATTFSALCKLGDGTFLPAGSIPTYLAACQKEKVLEAKLAEARQAMGAIGHAKGLVGHAKNKWIGGAERGIQKAKALLKDASTDAERTEAREELARCQANKAAGLEALAERQAALDKLLDKEPALLKQVEAATANLAAARASTQASVTALGVAPVLNDGKRDRQLVKYVVLLEATPRRLAEFAQQGEPEEQLVKKLLQNDELMMSMVLADGAARGNYVQAMKIYSNILTVSEKAHKGVLQRLALAISLELAVPVRQDNPDNAKDAPVYVDPVKRYLAYENAFLAGELDPAFERLNVWELRMVVYGSEPDETLAWGRQMLRDYRPDHIANPDYRWRYVATVRTEVPYRSGYGADDKSDVQFFQNILMNGGVCGRRAFFGRFILRAFGIPNTARPQPGHAALAHWTPDGWVLCFGAGWGSGWTRTRYEKDLDFLAATQVREDAKGFMQVKRAQWLGDVFGENRVFGLHGDTPGFWYGLSLYTQRGIIEASKAKALAAVGEELGEANDSKVKYDDMVADVKAQDRRISTDKQGVITISAVACSKPTQSTRKIRFMPSDLGGMQLHYNRVGDPEAFEYTLEVPTAGTYTLMARVATPKPDQQLSLSVNGSANPVQIDLPYTLAIWSATAPVEVTLAKGRNVLTFSRTGEDIRGLTIKDFVLTPMPHSKR